MTASRSDAEDKWLNKQRETQAIDGETREGSLVVNVFS